MKSLDLFLSRILPHVTACPEVVAKEALLDTAIEFCEKTLVVRQTLDPLSTDEGVLEYEVFPPAGEAVICPLQVWFKSRYLEPVAADLIRSVQAYNIDVPDVTAISATPTQYFWTAPSTIGLYPVPDTSEVSTLTVRAALKPTRSATTLEDVLYDNWIDVIVAGTLARLHMMKDQPWASADRALVQAQKFRAGTQRARIEGTVGRVRGSLSVRMRGF